MIASLRTPRWRRRAPWLQGLGLALLVVALFLPGIAVLVAVAVGLALFLLGAVAWLLRDAEPWRRPR